MADREKPLVHVEFFTKPLPNEKKSREQGRPIFEDREMVTIRHVGDRNGTLDAYANARAARDRSTNEWLTYAERYPEHYAAFKKGQQYFGEGTPLAEVPFLTEAKRHELKALNIHTVEALAAIDGTPLKQLGMGGRELKNQAQAWIDQASGSANLTKMAAENAALKEQMEALQRQVAEITSRPATAPSSAPASTQVAPPPGYQPSMFATWSDEEIKAWIAEQTGSRPRGNPNHSTLVQMADDLAAQQKAQPQVAA